MNLIVDDSYAYKGIVKISYKKNGEMRVFEYDNNGTALLFKTLARAMIGRSIYGLTPYKMDVTDSADGLGDTYLKKPLVITRRVVNTEVINDFEVYPAVFTSLLNLSDLKSRAMDGNSYYLSLVGSQEMVSGNNVLPSVLAVVELEKEVIKDIFENQGIQALI